MKTSTKIIAAAAAALSLGLAGAVLAHQGEGRGHGMGMGMGIQGAGHERMHGGDRAANASARLASLKAELKITAAQEPAWQQYETMVREQADAHQALRDKMQAQMQAQRQDPKAAAGADHAAWRESMMKLREANQAARETARQALFAVLTPEQKTLAEQRLQAGHGHGHGHRGGMQRPTT